MNTTEIKRRRLQNALWGLFIGDALAMPVHWYYNPDNIRIDFEGGIHRYEAPRHPHPESFMVGMDYRPDVENALRINRPYDILHDHVRFYSTPYSRLDIRSTDREDQHGNATPQLEERYHYHHGLAGGENTLGAHLVRVLMRSVIRSGRYDPDAFLRDFVEYLTTPGRNRDPYTEIYIRRWFENYSSGLPPRNCAPFQRDSWSIGSHGGLIRPLVVSMLAPSAYQGLGLAVEHHNLTHRSENNVSVLGILIPLIAEFIEGIEPETAAMYHSARVRVPKVSGEALFAAYRDHRGPGNIPKEDMWRKHTELEETPFDLAGLAESHTEEDVTRRLFATACYPEHGLPMLLYLVQQNGYDVESALLANANAGGDNVHRGMLLGLVVGAANDRIPDHLTGGLTDHERIREEIDAFSDIAVSTRGI